MKFIVVLQAEETPAVYFSVASMAVAKTEELLK